jgi:transcription termination/antitermination protein NusG
MVAMTDAVAKTASPLSATEWPGQSDGTWFVLRTKSRQEKVLHNDLASRGIANFLPLITQTKYYGDRKAKVEVPLFPGYVFLHGALDDAYVADRTRRVAQIIQVPDQKRLDWELRNIHIALGNCATLDPYPYLKSGVRVEVRDGPFRGLQGIIENRTRRDRLILMIDILGSAVSLEVDGSLLDVIE